MVALTNNEASPLWFREHFYCLLTGALGSVPGVVAGFEPEEVTEVPLLITPSSVVRLGDFATSTTEIVRRITAPITQPA
jgi:hypothetical protein